MSVIPGVNLKSSIGLEEPVSRIVRKKRDFPAWHFGMLNDVARNEAIESSIAALDLEGKTVFEIGTGAGLIALLFAKYGAARVYTCEINANLASAAQSVINSSGLASRIALINLSSTEVIDRGLLPATPDVIFTETLDCGVVGEGFFPVAADITRIAGPNTVIMPAWINQFCTPIQSEAISGLNRVDQACGFDLSLLNQFATPGYFPVHASLFPHQPMAEHVLIRHYSYRTISLPVPQVVDIEADGTVHGFLSWFRAEFGAGIVSNRPGLASHWHQAFHPLVEPLAVKRGDRISVLIDDDGRAGAARLAG
jgi:type I protein arginine methyltransferase